MLDLPVVSHANHCINTSGLMSPFHDLILLVLIESGVKKDCATVKYLVCLKAMSGTQPWTFWFIKENPGHLIKYRDVLHTEC